MAPEGPVKRCSYPPNSTNRTPNASVRCSLFGPLYRGAEPNNRTPASGRTNGRRGYEQ